LVRVSIWWSAGCRACGEGGFCGMIFVLDLI
jgi:hypothetical protein